MPGCSDAQAAVTATISNAMDPGTDATLSLCRDASPIDLFTVLGGTPDNTGTWADPAGAPFSGLLDPAVAAVGVYVYTTSPLLPCLTLFANVTVALDTIPYAGANNSFVSCADGPTTQLFPLLGPGADANQVWQDPSGDPHGGVVDPSLEVSGDYLYISTGLGECVHLVDTAVIAVTINPLPIVDLTVSPDSGCAPLFVDFTNLTDPAFLGGSCIWDLGDGSAPVNACGSLAHSYVAPGSYTVTLTVTTPAGCVDQLTVNGAVHVDPPPLATFVWDPNPGTETDHNVLFSATDPYATTFAWDFAGLGTGDQRQERYDFQVAYGDDYEICLQVWDIYGCTDTVCQVASIIVPSLFVPNAFTPDGDGQNEVFFPITADMVDEEHELLVFNRWGELIFQTKDARKGWDGRALSGGEILPQGVYVWRLVERKAYTAEKAAWFGTVTLLK
jgi:gliding motility-associated-like protein